MCALHEHQPVIARDRRVGGAYVAAQELLQAREVDAVSPPETGPIGHVAQFEHRVELCEQQFEFACDTSMKCRVLAAEGGPVDLSCRSTDTERCWPSVLYAVHV